MSTDEQGMPSYEDVYARSQTRAPFSNGTEGDAWQAGWCSRPGAPCVRDEQDGAGPEGASCPLIEVAIFANRTPQEWGGRTPVLGPDMYTCSKYEAGSASS